MHIMQNKYLKRASGFTVVELLIVIVVIGVLATVTIIGYSGVRNQANEASTKANARQASVKIQQYFTTNNETYPNSLASAGFPADSSSTYQYRSNNSSSKSYCVSATKQDANYFFSNLGSGSGLCAMQLVTTTSCPTVRTMAIDARDEKTYWIQKLSDGKCWMLTNLAYGGGGQNTYGDTKSLTDGTPSAATYTVASYYTPTGSTAATTQPQAPSTATDGSGQYGRVYNWCAAMGGQATAACDSLATPAVDTAISICPNGWRLPTPAELNQLLSIVNGGSTTSDAGLRANWLGQYSGIRTASFSNVGVSGWYWSSSAYGGGTSATYASAIFFSSTNANNTGPQKSAGLAVRCLAQ